MKVIIKPTSQIIANLGIEPNGEVQKYFVKRCADYMDRYVPYREGHLRDYRIEGNYVIYHQPYARYQYYGIREDGTHKVNPENYTTAGTGPYWDKRMWSIHQNDIINELQKKIGG